MNKSFGATHGHKPDAWQSALIIPQALEMPGYLSIMSLSLKESHPVPPPAMEQI